MKKPNIVYIHCHDMGRYCQPFGYDIPAPNLMKLAKQGTLFRQCYASAPTCGPSRAALVTGQYPHCCGMLGLPSPDLGYKLNDYNHHIAAFLQVHGYETALSGVQHVARAPFAPPEECLPYGRFLNNTPAEYQIHDPARTVPAAVEYLKKEHDKPFFLSVGLLDPHRDNKKYKGSFIESVRQPEPDDIVDQAKYCRPWPHMPDNPVTRREMANFKRGVASMDRDLGKLMAALDTPELRDNTLVIFTTDHGPGISEYKATLFDGGIGVTLVMRSPASSEYGDPALFAKGKVVDGLTQHIDLFPTICDLLGVDHPDWLQGKSVLPLVKGEKEQTHDAVYSEQTYHHNATPRPLRAVRSERYKYIRSFDPKQPRGVDPGPAHFWWVEQGYSETLIPDEMLFDLYFDPHEANNLADRGTHDDILKDIRQKLDTWMKETDDPLKDGILPKPPVQG
jgi:arylsulfatase A-like enzyme